MCGYLTLGGAENTRVLKKIDSCGKELTNWSQKHFGSIRKELAQKRKEQARYERLALQGGNATRLLAIQKEINSLMDKEERMWRQRSRTLYLKDGDRNTQFFHCRATIRKRRNTIAGVRDQSEQWCNQADQIANVFGEYYQELFTSVNPESMPNALSSIPQLVTEDMNSTLTENFQAWEVENALKQMAPQKAPGLDGMPPLFFQNYWDLVKGDITDTILNFLNSGSLPSPLNHTFVTLIPKVKNPERVTEFRPISLCNVLYKIFRKS